MPFRDIVGHRSLIALLARSIHRGALPPSLIFAGPAGVGKKLTALQAAAALNCLEPVSYDAGGQTGTDACGVCASCTRIARGVHPDVVVVEPGDTGSIKIDQVRAVIDSAAYRPFEGRRRVVILDEADALVDAAQNALLKTLEEPPSASIFILVTSRPDALLPTVRSRCPRLRFRPLGARDIAQALVARGRSDTDAQAVAAAADGSLARALGATVDEFVQARATAREVLVELGRQRDARQRLETAKALVGTRAPADREDLASNLHAMAALVRDAALVATGADTSDLANPDVRAAVDQLAQAYGGERGVKAFAAIDRALVGLDRNVNAKILADWLVLQL